MATSRPPLTLEIIGEGKADIGSAEGKAAAPTKGVLPVLVHKLCGSPANLLVKRRAPAFLQGKGWWQKVRFAKQQAYYNQAVGAVFVLDTEGEQKSRIRDLQKGRDSWLPEFPMAVGAPHPCIEVWLLADAGAIVRALQCPKPDLPASPEVLPAPQRNRQHNPKTVLAACLPSGKGSLNSVEMTRIAVALNDIALLRQRCPASFAPFADEIEEQIKPLFTDQ